MKKFLSFLMILSLILFGLQACINEDTSLCDDENPVDQAAQVIKFASHNLNIPKTRTSLDGNEWVTGDLIGIYMLDNALGTGIGGSLAANRRYVGTLRPPAVPTGYSMADFTPDAFDQTIYYPELPVTDLDFIAYYPWKPAGNAPGEIDNYLYPIDVTVQTNPAEIDLLYSNDVTAHPITPHQTIDLGFAHMLSKIVLNVGQKAGSNIMISGMTASLHEMMVQATIDLGDTSQLALKPDKAVIKMLGLDNAATRPPNYDTTYQAIIIPHMIDGDKVQLIGGEGRQFTWTIPKGGVFEHGKIYTYNLTLVGETVIEFTGTITPWDASPPSIDDEVGHDPSGTVSQYVFPNGVDSMHVVYVRAGEFMMGSGDILNATPHKVTLSNGFRIGEAEVTNAQYAKFLNALKVPAPLYSAPTDVQADISAVLNDPTLTAAILFKTTVTLPNVAWDSGSSKWVAASGREDFPATSISWYGAKAYAVWAGGDLPTEAQWEYAARATVDVSKKYQGAAGDGSDAISWARFNQPDVQAVKQLTSSNWALFDMFGNVAEWTKDAVESNADYPYASLAQTDPCNNTPSGVHPLRGGSYLTPLGTDLKISARNTGAGNTSTATIPDAGFRVVFK